MNVVMNMYALFSFYVDELGIPPTKKRVMKSGSDQDFVSSAKKLLTGTIKTGAKTVSKVRDIAYKP